VASHPPPDTILRPLNGPERPLSQYLTTFPLLLIVLDPFTHESAWLLETGSRILDSFGQADCRVGWLVAGDADECRQFLGPHAQRFITFSDPDRDVIKALGLERLPALICLGLDATVIDAAEGWQPTQWRAMTDRVARMLGWTGPKIPSAKDPASFAGSPALG
jgi:hypothetical protein